MKRNRFALWPGLRSLISSTLDSSIPPALAAYLERMQLAAPASPEERRWQRLLVRELKAVLRA
jgi:hypothetical protein